MAEATAVMAVKAGGRPRRGEVSRGGEDGGGGRGRGGGDDSRGGRDEDGGRRGRGAANLAPDIAREAVSKGWALSLGAVLPTVAAAVPGDILDVHLQQVRGGDWVYEVLVLTPDRRYRQVLVDARRNRILQIRRR